MHKEMKIAIYVLLFALGLGFFLGFFTSRAFACDSYQDCMDQPVVMSTENPLRAIAFKLDEISKKLDSKTSGTSSKITGTTFTGEMEPYTEQPAHSHAGEDGQ